MCGLTGLVLGRLAKRRVREIEALTDTFTKLLLLSEYRGPHATGVAWVKRDGAMQVAKAPLPARRFVQHGRYLDWLLGIDRQVTYVMGHTRWPSRGSIRNPANNHPLVLPVQDEDLAGYRVAVTHNGTLHNADVAFARLMLPRDAQVDSELLVRLAQRHIGANGLDLPAYLDALATVEGTMSLALVATNRPEEIILLKGNMPLEVRIHPRARVLVYASEAHILDRALAGEAGWKTVPLAHGEGVVVNTHTWTLQRVPFTFHGIHADAGVSYTGTITRKELSQ